MDAVRFHASFSFTSSERPGTRALELGESVPNEVRVDRLRTLQALQEEHTQAWLKSMLGTRQEVLIEGVSKTNPDRVSGRSAQNRPVHVDGDFEPGTLTANDHADGPGVAFYTIQAHGQTFGVQFFL